MLNENKKKIRVAVTYRVCQNWRAPIFARLARHPDIELMVFHGEDIPGTKLINTRNFDGIPHRQLRTRKISLSSSGRKSDWVLHPDILKELRQFQPDVLLCEGGSNFFNNLLINAWAWRHGVPTIHWTLGYIPGRRRRGLSTVFKFLSDRMMKRSSVLLGYSSRAKRYFEMHRCKQPQFIAVNCVDTDLIFRKIEAAKACPIPVRRNFDLDGKKVVLFVGALTREKHIDILLRAFDRIRRQRQDVGLLIVGDGVARQDLEALVAELKTPDVHFAGQVIDGASHYFLAGDLFVLPGLGGLAISEAMCHALPLICTVADGCEEDLVVPGRNGLILPEGDVDALARGIEELLDDPARLAAMGRASLETIQTQYNVHTYFQGILDSIYCAYRLKEGKLCQA